MTENELARLQRLTDGSDHVLLGRKAAEHGFLSDRRAVHPDSELPSFPFDEIGVHVERRLECRGRTDRAGTVVSGPAEADGDGGHEYLPHRLQPPGSGLQALHSAYCRPRPKTEDYRL